MHLLLKAPLIGAAMAIAIGCDVSQATPVVTTADIDFTGASTSFGYFGSQFTFTDVSSGFFDPNAVGVTTAAGAKVSSLALFGPVEPTTYFDPIRGSGHLVFDATSQYSSFANTPIPYSATASFIGLSLDMVDGTHYGYAEFDGTYLVSYAFESSAGVGIDAAGAVAAVPEPASAALLLLGLGAVGFVANRRKT